MMKIKIILKNHNGISLVGVLVALAVLGIVSLILADVFNSMFKASRSIEQKAAVIDIKRAIYNELSKVGTCTVNFSGVDPMSGLPTPTQITNASTIPIYVVGSNYENNLIQLAALSFINWLPDAAPPSINQYTGTVDLRIGFQNLGNTIGPPAVSRTIKLRLELNGFTGAAPANQIKACSAFGAIDSIWTQNLSGSIYYNGGFVGINTNAPTKMLDVQGDLNVTGDASANAYWYTSDMRLKKNVHPVKGLDLVRRLQGVQYQWRKNNKPDIGLIAQDVEKILPELVYSDEKTGLKSVKLANFVALLIESTKELYKSNLKLQKRVEELEKNNHNSDHQDQSPTDD